MIKVLVHVTKAVVAAILTILCVSCGFESIHGSGNVITQQRDVKGDFTEISAGRGLEVSIEQGSSRSITVEADDNLMEHIKTTVSGSELKITSDANLDDNATKKVTVTLPEIKSIEASSGADVTAKNTLKSKSLELESSSGGHLEAAIETDDATCKTSSGSSLAVSGTAKTLQAHASSGSNMKADKLEAGDVDAEASSGGSIYIYPLSSLNAKASSGGHIYFAHTPDKLKKDISSGGNVDPK